MERIVFTMYLSARGCGGVIPPRSKNIRFVLHYVFRNIDIIFFLLLNRTQRIPYRGIGVVKGGILERNNHKRNTIKIDKVVK